MLTDLVGMMRALMMQVGLLVRYAGQLLGAEAGPQS